MELPVRRPNRLLCFDYRAGAYFVTICTEDRRKTLCDIVGDGFPVPKKQGQIAQMWIHRIQEKYPSVIVDHYVVMPNHIHVLLRIAEGNGTGDPSPTLGSVIGWYKYMVTKEINEGQGSIGTRVFQRSFHDHVIRNERDYMKIWEYIDNNPRTWQKDCFYE